jgi:hypothetical protein
MKAGSTNISLQALARRWLDSADTPAESCSKPARQRAMAPMGSGCRPALVPRSERPASSGGGSAHADCAAKRARTAKLHKQQRLCMLQSTVGLSFRGRFFNHGNLWGG